MASESDSSRPNTDCEQSEAEGMEDIQQPRSSFEALISQAQNSNQESLNSNDNDNFLVVGKKKTSKRIRSHVGRPDDDVDGEESDYEKSWGKRVDKSSESRGWGL